MAEMTLTEANTGQQLGALPGDEIVIRLAENPTTGYRWQLANVDGPIEPAGDSFELAPNPQIGSGGVREFRFRAVGPGAAHLELKHLQAWEGERSVDRRFAADIRIAG